MAHYTQTRIGCERPAFIVGHEHLLNVTNADDNALEIMVERKRSGARVARPAELPLLGSIHSTPFGAAP